MSQDAQRELALLVQAGWRVVAIETFEDARALRLLEHVGRKLDKKLLTWSSASGLQDPRAPEPGAGAGGLDAGLRAMSTEPHPALFAVLDAGAVVGDPVAVRRLRDLLPLLQERGQTIVMIGPVVDLPRELERECSHLALPLPRRDELEALFRKACGENPDEDALQAAVGAALGLTAREAQRVFRRALLATGGLDAKAADEIVRKKRAALRRTPALEFCEAQGHLGEVGGLGELKRWLRDRRRAFGEEARAYGLPVPRGLLLLGVQGCGKSLCAKAVAREWQFPLLRLDIARAFSGGGDQSPELVMREAMAVAESIAPAVLWIDELEKGFAAKDRDGAATRVFGAFLTWLSEKTAPVFVVATANDVQALPPELLRRGRFDDLFFVDLPNHEERMEILSIHLRKRGRDPLQFALDDLAHESSRFSGAELEQVIAAGLYHAFSESRELADNDLVNAMSETVPLYDTYEKQIKDLRDWARTRARPATLDPKLVNLFS